MAILKNDKHDSLVRASVLKSWFGKAWGGTKHKITFFVIKLGYFEQMCLYV